MTTTEFSTPILSVVPQPNDSGTDNSVFGGWLLSQLDLAGAIVATESAKGRVATIAVKDMRFINPVFTYDVVKIYGDITAKGNTSITVKLTVYADRNFAHGEKNVHIAEAIFVYVAIEKPGLKRNL